MNEKIELISKEVVDCAFKIHVELKSVEKIARVHLKQLLTYLRLTHLPLGLMINFGEEFIKNGIHRVANTSRLKINCI